MIGGIVDRHTIIIVRAPEVDDGRGNRGRDWSQASRTPSEGWAIDANGGAVDGTNRDGASTSYTLRGPFDADVQDTDRIEVLGATFTLTVGVLRQPGPSPLTSHTVLNLSAWKG